MKKAIGFCRVSAPNLDRERKKWNILCVYLDTVIF